MLGVCQRSAHVLSLVREVHHTCTPNLCGQVRLMAKEHLGRYKNTWDCLMQVRPLPGVVTHAECTGVAVHPAL